MLHIVKEGAVGPVDADVPAVDRFFENKLPIERLRIISTPELGHKFHDVSQSY